MRVVPIEASLSATPTVTTYDQAHELVKGKKPIAVAPCICKKSEMMLGNTSCDRPLDRCILFEFAAQYYIDNKMAREITEEELNDLFKTCEEKGLVLSFTNSKDIVISARVRCCCATSEIKQFQTADICSQRFTRR